MLLLSCINSYASTFDNILKVVFYCENDSSYLILHESVYHPTSGSYEKGNIRSQGYNSSRISVYNLNSGKIIVQKDMGSIDSTEACIVLGCSENNLWIYCQKFKSGLQSFNPKTLKRQISQAKIYSKINISIGRFLEPDWRNIKNYYDYDAIQQKLIVTNSDYKQFYIDAKTFATEPLTEKITLNQELNKYLDESATFKDSTWKLEGYNKMAFKCNDFQAQKPTYIFGQFILEQNKIRLFKHFSDIQESLLMNQEYSSDNKQAQIEDSKQNIESLIQGKSPDEVLLQTDKNSFYVLSKSSDTPDAFLKISKIESTEFGIFSELWSVSPPGMFYNVAQARNTPKFKNYFGDIFPEFTYQFFQTYNNKLLIIHLQHVGCIDIDTGNLLWYFKLK